MATEPTLIFSLAQSPLKHIYMSCVCMFPSVVRSQTYLVFDFFFFLLGGVMCGLYTEMSLSLYYGIGSYDVSTGASRSNTNRFEST